MLHLQTLRGRLTAKLSFPESNTLYDTLSALIMRRSEYIGISPPSFRSNYYVSFKKQQNTKCGSCCGEESILSKCVLS